MSTEPSLDMDLISNLPSNIIDSILMLLPIRQAVKTSILSTKWRYKWVNIPRLIFNKDCCPLSLEDSTLDQLKRVNIVDQVLLHHKGPINMFVCLSFIESCPDIDRWILFLSNNGIKEFVLWPKAVDDYMVPSCLFSCQEMRNLKLIHCILRPPPQFYGFPKLRMLQLWSTTITANALEHLISHCLLLENLILEDCDIGSDVDLKIRAPTLRKVYIKGEFETLCFENATLLEIASINLHSMPGNAAAHFLQDPTCKSNLSKVLGCLHGIKGLEMKGHFLKFLALGVVPKWLPATYDQLTKLSLSISTGDLNEMLAVLCMLKSFPNIQELGIKCRGKAFDERAAHRWEEEVCCDWSLSHLRTVKLNSMSGLKPELDIAEFILANSPELDAMSITVKKNVFPEEEKRIFKELMRFRRASARAQIFYLEKPSSIWFW